MAYSLRGGGPEEVVRSAEAMRGFLWSEAPDWVRELIGRWVEPVFP